MAITYRQPHFFVDTETTRLRRPYLPGGRRIWEIGGTRVEVDGTEHHLHRFVRIADLALAELLPAEERADLTDTGTGTLTEEGYTRLPEAVRQSLDIGGFHQRHPERGGEAVAPVVSETELAQELLNGPWLKDRPALVGAVPAFEDLGLFDVLHGRGLIGPDDELWDYYLECAVSRAAGFLGLTRPWDSHEVSAAIGVNPAQFQAHTAVDDAAWAREMFEATIDLAQLAATG